MKRKLLAVIVGADYASRTRVRHYLQNRYVILEANALSEVESKIGSPLPTDAVLATVNPATANWPQQLEILASLRLRNEKPILIVVLESEHAGEALPRFVAAPRMYFLRKPRC